jgi:membrane-bound acyltransferase YfiQ involved in biofilm formation
MRRTAIILTVVFLLLTSVTSVVMLSSSFESFHEKYLPAFLLGQKFVLPLILAAMAVGYLVFFEPERLLRRRTRLILAAALVIVTGLFVWFLSDAVGLGNGSLTLYLLQLLSLISMIVLFSVPPRR